MVYRWISLIPALLALSVEGPALPGSVGALLAALVVNLCITLFPAQLNDALRRRPWLLLADLLFCAGLAGLTGGWATPYYLYAFSPLLAAAFFFELGGALIAAGALSGLFVFATAVPAPAQQNWPRVVAEVVGFFLIAGAFGYATSLLGRLQISHADLNQAHRDLEVIHGLTLSLQSATDVNEVEERVLTAVTTELAFPRAVIALVDQNERVITSWLGKSRDGRPLFAGGMPHPARVPLAPESGAIARSLLEGRTHLAAPDVRTSLAAVDSHLGEGAYHVFPLLLREHAVGVLLVGAPDFDDAARLKSLQAVASQAAVAVGTTMLCIDRAQRLAVQDERMRFAREIHDTVSQSLFGLTYSLEACIKLLPAQADTVKSELASLRQLADAARAELRQSILDNWPSELTPARFASDLRRYVDEACRGAGVEVEVQVHGDFGTLSAGIRRSLYRIAQEALNNVVRHATASQARVCVDVLNGQALLAVRDTGRGFDTHLALSRETNREHFGLLGIRDRTAALSGSFEILSRPGAGTTVLVTIPVGNGR